VLGSITDVLRARHAKAMARAVGSAGHASSRAATLASQAVRAAQGSLTPRASPAPTPRAGPSSKSVVDSPAADATGQGEPGPEGEGAVTRPPIAVTPPPAGVDAEPHQGRIATRAQPARAALGGIGQEIQHHAFMVAHEAGDIVREIAGQFAQPCQNARAVGAMVDVVADKDQLWVFRPAAADMGVDQFEDQFKQVGAPVQIAHDICGRSRARQIGCRGTRRGLFGFGPEKGAE
jgi:hypothetical protein